MNETILTIAALAGVMLIIIIYIAIKDRDTARKLAMMEAGIDGANQEIFRLSKSIESLRKEVARELADFETKMEESHPVQIDEGMMHELVEPLAREIAYLQEQIDTIQSDLKARVERLDGQVRKVTFATDHIAPDEQKIIKLHNQGLDSAMIAKQLRLGKGEVELVLKFSKIHD